MTATTQAEEAKSDASNAAVDAENALAAQIAAELAADQAAWAALGEIYFENYNFQTYAYWVESIEAKMASYTAEGLMGAE